MYSRPRSLKDVKTETTESRKKLTQINEALLVQARKEFYKRGMSQDSL